MPYLRTVDEAGNEVCVDTISQTPEPIYSGVGGVHYYADWSAISANGRTHKGRIVFRYNVSAVPIVPSLAIHEQTGLHSFSSSDDSESQTRALVEKQLWVAALFYKDSVLAQQSRRKGVSHE